MPGFLAPKNVLDEEEDALVFDAEGVLGGTTFERRGAVLLGVVMAVASDVDEDEDDDDDDDDDDDEADTKEVDDVREMLPWLLFPVPAACDEGPGDVEPEAVPGVVLVPLDDVFTVKGVEVFNPWLPEKTVEPLFPLGAGVIDGVGTFPDVRSPSPEDPVAFRDIFLGGEENEELGVREVRVGNGPTVEADLFRLDDS